jgi:hypothetical protein
LKLPGELRNIVYELVLGGETWWIYSFLHSLNRDITTFALLRVCQQIYKETRLLPYSTNTLRARSPHRIKLWVRGLSPEQRGAIKTVKFAIPHLIFPLWTSSHPLAFCELTGLKRIVVQTDYPTPDVVRSQLDEIQKRVEGLNPGVEVIIEC